MNAFGGSSPAGRRRFRKSCRPIQALLRRPSGVCAGSRRAIEGPAQRSGIAPPTDVPSFAVAIRGEAARDRVSGTVGSVVVDVVVTVVVTTVVEGTDDATAVDVVESAGTVGDVVVAGVDATTVRVVVGGTETSARESGGFGGSVPDTAVSDAALRPSSVGSGSTKGRSPGRSINWIDRSTMIGVPGDETTNERPVTAT